MRKLILPLLVMIVLIPSAFVNSTPNYWGVSFPESDFDFAINQSLDPQFDTKYEKMVHHETGLYAVGERGMERKSVDDPHALGIYRFDYGGVLVWETIWEPPSQEFDYECFYTAPHIMIYDDIIYILLETRDFDDWYYYILSFDLEGAPLLESRYHRDMDTEFNDLIVNEYGIYVIGTVLSDEDLCRDINIRLFDFNGNMKNNITWEKSVSLDEDMIISQVKHDTDNIFVLGYSVPDMKDNSTGLFVISLEMSLNVIWEYWYHNTYADDPDIFYKYEDQFLILNEDKILIVSSTNYCVGEWYSFTNHPGLNFLIALNLDGTLAYNVTLKNNADKLLSFEDVKLFNNIIYCIGTQYIFPDENFFIIAYNTMGEIQWESYFNDQHDFDGDYFNTVISDKGIFLFTTDTKYMYEEWVDNEVYAYYNGSFVLHSLHLNGTIINKNGMLTPLTYRITTAFQHNDTIYISGYIHEAYSTANPIFGTERYRYTSAFILGFDLSEEDELDDEGDSAPEKSSSGEIYPIIFILIIFVLILLLIIFNKIKKTRGNT